jgi:hypothetical protein
MSETNQEELDKAMKELDDIAKSKDAPVEDELDALTKALEEELGDDLSKSDDEQSDKEDDKEDADGDKEEGEKDGDKDADDKDAEAEPIGKSDEETFDEELVKASDAFYSLEKSVSDMGNGLFEEISTIKKSLGALLNLTIKQAHVIASLSKSRAEDVETIAKSVAVLGAAPVAPGRAVLGIGSLEEIALQKSVSTIQDALLKAVQEGTVAAHYLSSFGTYKDVNRLPADVRETIGC